MSAVKCLAGAGGFIASGGGDDLIRCGGRRSLHAHAQRRARRASRLALPRTQPRRLHARARGASPPPPRRGVRTRAHPLSRAP